MYLRQCININLDMDTETRMTNASRNIFRCKFKFRHFKTYLDVFKYILRFYAVTKLVVLYNYVNCLKIIQNY